MLSPLSPDTQNLNQQSSSPGNQTVDSDNQGVGRPQEDLFDEFILAENNVEVNITDGGLEELGKEVRGQGTKQ